MREKESIIQSLHSSNSGGDRPVNNEIVVDIGVAGGQRGRVNLPTNHGNPVGSFKHLGLKVPITTNDKRAFETLDQNGGVLQNEQVGLAEPLIDAQVDAENIDPTFAKPPHP